MARQNGYSNHTFAAVAACAVGSFEVLYHIAPGQLDDVGRAGQARSISLVCAGFAGAS